MRMIQREPQSNAGQYGKIGCYRQICCMMVEPCGKPTAFATAAVSQCKRLEQVGTLKLQGVGCTPKCDSIVC